jgi:hypothetical protein
MMRVISDAEKQKITHRKSNIQESPHQEDVMTKTHREDRKSYVHKSTCQEVVKDKAYIEDIDVRDSKNQQTLNRRSDVHESTCEGHDEQDLPRGGEGRGLHGEG